MACVALVVLPGACKKAKVEASIDHPSHPSSTGVPSGWENGEAPPDRGGKGARNALGHSGGDRAIATLPGFRTFEDGSSRVFLEIVGKVPVSELDNGGVRLVYRMQGTTVSERVNRLALPTTFFDTPVGNVHVEQTGVDADLVIELRQPAKPHLTVRQNDDVTVVSVDFAPVVRDQVKEPVQGLR
jgi:AMIN domain-containing protein